MKQLTCTPVALLLIALLFGESASDYPTEAYFRTHSFQQSWSRINEVYQEAVDEFDAEQKELEQERSRRLGQARGDEAQKAVHRWYDERYKELAERRRLEYSAKEAVQKIMIDFYNKREKSVDPLGRPELRDAPVWKNAPVPDIREMPEYKNAPAAVKASVSKWQKDAAEHQRRKDSILKAMTREITMHLLRKDRLKGSPTILQKELELYRKNMKKLREQLRQENARFEKIVLAH